MNTTETKSSFSSRLTRIAVLLALLACSLPSIGNDGRDPRHIQYVYGLYLFWHEGLTNDHYGSHCVVTYKDTTFNTYSGDVEIPYYNWNYIIDEIGDCAFKDCVGLNSIKMSFKVLQIDSCSFQNCKALKSVAIPYTMRTIGEKAFQNCAKLDTIIIRSEWSYPVPSQVTSIGDGAFQNCYSLSSVDFPQVKTIGSRAFRSCRSLKKINIPSGATSIGEAAFKGCTQLDTVFIGHACDGLPIGKNTFAECNSLKVIVCDALEPPVLEQGAGLTAEQLATIKVIVPHSSIEAYRQAPYWKDMNLKEKPYDLEVDGIYYMVIDEDEVWVTYKDTNYSSYIGNYVDEDEIDMYESPLHGGFENWRGMSIPEKITFTGKTYQVTGIGDNAFKNCTRLNIIDWSTKAIKHIGEHAFEGCNNLKFVYLPNQLETIGAHAFDGCSFLHVIVLPKSVTAIGDYAFQGCSKLTSIRISSPLTMGKGAFHNAQLKGHAWTGGYGVICDALTPPVMADSTSFDDRHYANSNILVLHSLVDRFRSDVNWNRFVHIARMPYDFMSDKIYYCIKNENEVGVVPDNETFYGTYGYSEYNIPETVNYSGQTYRVTSIDDMAFYFSQVNRVTVPNSVKRIGNFAFGKSFIEHVNLGDSVETIGKGAFNETPWLTSLHFPKSVKEIGDSALFNTPDLMSITVDSENPVYDSREDCNALIHTATNRLIAGGSNCTAIPSTVSDIGGYAFYGKEYLSHISIPGSVKTIGPSAFLFCLGLNQVTLEEGINRIDRTAFCFTGLTSVVVPNSVDTIVEGAFGAISNIRSITLGSGLKFIGSMAFSPSSGRTSVVDTVMCLAAVPPVMEAANCFEGAYGRATLYVPQASLELYKNDPNWSQFYKIRAIESSGIGEISVDEGTPTVRYNLQGQPVDDGYRGVVIENGKKILVE